MSIRIERWMRGLIHGKHGRWIMLGLLIAILVSFTVISEVGDWLFGKDASAGAPDSAGSFAVLPGEITDVTYPEFEAARWRYGLALTFMQGTRMDRVRDTDVWAYLVLLEAAKREGITVSGDELREIMESGITGRGVPDYIFNDEAKYRQWVQEAFHVTAPQLEAAVLEFARAGRVRDLYRECFVVAPAATRKTALEQAANQNVELAYGDYAALDAARFLPEVEAELKADAEADKKLRDFFDKDASVKLDDRFRHPRRYKLELFYSIHANVNTDEAFERIRALVLKAFPDAKPKVVNVQDRKTYFGTYRDRLLSMVGKTWSSLTDDMKKEEKPAEPKDGDKPAEPKDGDKPAEPKDGDKPDGEKPAEPEKPDPLDPVVQQRLIAFGYQIVKEQVGREVELRSIFEFLYEQAKNDVSLKELYEKLKAHDNPENPVCSTEPGKGLIVYRDFDGKALSGDELQEIEDSGVKFGISFRPRVTGLGDTDLPKKSPKADTLGNEGHGRQFFRLLEVIREQRKTFEELTDGEREDLRKLFYLPEQARERAKTKLDALRQALASGELKADAFAAEAGTLGCRVHAGEWVEATYDFMKEPDEKQLWPDEYLHMRDRYFLRKSLAQVLGRDREQKEWKPTCFLPVDVDIRRGAEEPGAAYLFQLRDRKRPDATTIPPGEVVTYLNTFASQRNREEMERWTDDWEQLRTQFRMTFEKEMQGRIDEEQKREQESKRRRSGR